MAKSSVTDGKDLLRKFRDKAFIDNMLDQLNQMCIKLNIVDRYLFSGYNELMQDVQDFKDSLLKLILESKIHLKVLKDNFDKPRYQKASDEVKLSFIKERLDKIDRATLFDYIKACQKLIQTSLDLHKQYGTAIFKLKYVALKALGFTGIGAIAGFGIGLVLPFCSVIEATCGAAFGLVGGLAYAIYQLGQKMNQIEIVRGHLIEINEALKKVQLRLNATRYQLGQSQEELNEQLAGKSFQEVKDLEGYVLATHDEFLQLEPVLMSVKVGEHT
ncbi:unnamed protein product [Rotaria socialis]|uniref:Uncharacterized protein n=1 Tax=Rotaria socialis TaxID=392032 RepID=A0A817UE07_9BILA|nr:unnamed protein product [Rotaria socialis]CAF3322214.1 unnamed protein product [Rotaria socialis]CAF3327323.1 unnamed protein product [Rotaria socialis]CAF3441333.1 unnamed protein product [Rotaria socialis]CAF3661640.1 unnamed protein product [Rotaria socialis]